MTTVADIDVPKPEDQSKACILPLPFYKEYLANNKVLWDSRDKGDCRLDISHFESLDIPKAVRQENGKVLVTEAEKSPCNIATIMCHTFILIAGSEYFRTRLQGYRSSIIPSDTGSEYLQQQQQQLKYMDGRKDGIVCLKEQLTCEDELPVFEAMLKSLYLLEIDPDLSIPQLLMLIELTDRYAAVLSRKASLHVLSSKIDAGGINDEEMNSICNFEPTNKEGWQAIEEEVDKRLMDIFEASDDILHTESLRDQFKNLTWNAVRRYLMSDKLVIDCEESIALLARIWVVDGGEMQRMKDANKEQYSNIIADIETNIIRFGFLSPSFCIGFLKESWLTFAPLHQEEICRMTLAPKEFPMKWDSQLPTSWYTTRPKEYSDGRLTCVVQIDESTFRERLSSALTASVDTRLDYQEYYTAGWWFYFLICTSGGSVHLKVQMRNPFLTCMAFIQTEVLLCDALIASYPFLDMTVKDPEGFTHLACIMEADVAQNPGSWPDMKYFLYGEMELDVRVQSIH